MNNILKVLLGVLAISGFAVMIMPSGDPLAAPEQTEQPAIPVVEPTDLPTVAPAPTQAEESVDESESPEEDYSSFGQPMMDAAPLGGSPAQQKANPDGQAAPLQTAPDTGVPVAGNPNASMAPGQLPVVQ